MAKKLLIVHGYSDGSSSFTALGDFLVRQGAYSAADVSYLDYSSMDDQATFLDFADKLDTDHQNRLKGERVDVVCHSTGSLVVRAWLALHRRRAVGRGETDAPCPVDRLVCFAPANFGSDLAGLGQSFLGKFRSTFFNSHSHKGDFLESGKVVLQGLEPASPFQWLLSFEHDLHGGYTYFTDTLPEAQRCYPFVLAAGEAYGGLEAALIKQRGRQGTDGTVRISGTNLNTRACTLDFRRNGPILVWWQRKKFDAIPFSMFAGFNHGSIIDPDAAGFDGPDGPGTLALEVLKGSTTLDLYKAAVARFSEAFARNYARLPAARQELFQQFFFRVQDDVGQLVEDYFVDFHVVNRDDSLHQQLTSRFDDDFKTQVTLHSTTKSHRVFLMSCSKLEEFHQGLRDADARLVLEVTGVSPLPDVKYDVSRFVAYDPQGPFSPTEPVLLEPNTTTLVNVILNREQTDRLATITDGITIEAEGPPKPKTAAPATGRAALLSDRRS